MLAAEKGHGSIVKLLADRDADIHPHTTNDENISNLLRDRGAVIDLPSATRGRKRGRLSGC